MSTPFKLLLVEDNQQDAAVCRSSMDAYKEQKKRHIELVHCESFEQAISALNSTFDGAIIDLKLASKGYQGNDVLDRIRKAGLRIPTAIMTATPGATKDHFTYVGTFKKGEVQYAEIFDAFWGIYNAGLTRIMGGRGVIEESLTIVCSARRNKGAACSFNEHHTRPFLVPTGPWQQVMESDPTVIS